MLEHSLSSPSVSGRLASIAAVMLLAGGISGAGAEPAEMPRYVPKDFEVPPTASYREANGAITVVGYNDMSQMLEQLNARFIEAHPDIQFDMRLHGTATAAPALAYGISAYAPMGAEFSDLELASFRALNSQDPLQIRVAHCALNPGARSAPLAIFVNRKNPITKLTVSQIRRTFATGDSRGDFTRWGQLGAPGDWSQRQIRPLGIAEERTAGLAMYMTSFVTKGLPFSPAFEGLLQSSAVVARVGEDPAAIGFASANLVSPAVKAVAIANATGDGYYLPTTENIISDRYPLNRHLFIYVNRTTAGHIDPFVREFLRLVLSREGQATIANARPEYFPLNAEEVGEELQKLN